MTIHLPEDIERNLRAQVSRGRFASLDDALAEAARRLLEQLDSRMPELQRDPFGDDFLFAKALRKIESDRKESR